MSRVKARKESFGWHPKTVVEKKVLSPTAFWHAFFSFATKLKSFLRRDECIYKDSTSAVGSRISNMAQSDKKEEKGERVGGKKWLKFQKGLSKVSHSNRFIFEIFLLQNSSGWYEYNLDPNSIWFYMWLLGFLIFDSLTPSYIIIHVIYVIKTWVYLK